MSRGIFVTLFVLVATSGCSVYDVAAISADVALEILTGMNEGKDSTDNNPYNDPNWIWNYETSQCIRSETNKNDLDEQLDAAFDSIEKDQDFVVLPTGEEYAIEAPPSHKEPSSSPTAICLERELE